MSAATTTIGPVTHGVEVTEVRFRVTTQVAELSAGSEQEPRAQCSFCGKYRDQVAGLVVSSARTGRNTSATICTECLDLCIEIVIEEFPETPT